MDTSTYATVISRLTSMVAVNTRYNPTKDVGFVDYRGMKSYVMEKAKQAGLGRLTNQPSAFSVAVSFSLINMKLIKMF